jgi:hypothetical protein
MRIRPAPKRIHQALVLLGLVTVLLPGSASFTDAQVNSAESQSNGIWGQLGSLSNTSVVVDGTRYPYAPNVIIHTRDVKPDKRGNVKVTLDERGQAIEVSLYGIEESEAMTRYFRYDG